MSVGKENPGTLGTPTEATSPLSPQRAFVVQFRTGLVPWAGRVEHVVSGRATRFQSAEELWVFMTQVMSEEGGEPP